MPDLKDARRKVKIALAALAVVDVIAIAVFFSPLVGSETSRREQLDQAWKELQQKTREVEPLRGLDKKIPVARLNALPFSTTCINCQREMETNGSYSGNGHGADWEKVVETRSPLEEEQEVTISDLELDVSSR